MPTVFGPMTMVRPLFTRLEGSFFLHNIEIENNETFQGIQDIGIS